MAPIRQSAGSAPRDINSVDRRASHDIPRSLPRFEGFASTLGGFARSPQVSRTPSRFLPRNDEPRRPSEAHSSSAFVRSLQTPLLHQDASEASSSNQQQPPQSLLARSLGSLTDAFSQVTLQLSRILSFSKGGFVIMSFACRKLSPSEREKQRNPCCHSMTF